MPATVYKLTQKSPQPKSMRRTEEIELATVYLELNSHVQPTWGQPVEPDAYITDLEGHILVPDDGADREVRVGTVSAHSVHLGEAYEDGVSWFDLLDARSADTAMYAVLIDPERSCYTEWIESTFEPFGSDLLILDRIRIEPEYRGLGYGLYAAQLMITGFASNGMVACVPAPYELLKGAAPREIGESRTKRDKPIPGWAAAEAKLRKHWSLLGFEQVPNSDVFALSLTGRRPSMETIMQRYFAGKRRRRSNAQLDA
jgi:GNAT superfamily N-acetyltransferase